MANQEEVSTLVERMPAADNKGMYTENIDGEKIEKAVSAIYEGGGESLQQVIRMLAEPGSEQDVKPHYALHCVVNRSLVQQDETKRRELCEVMADGLHSDLSAYHKAYLCQELQWAGGAESVAGLGELLLDESLVEPAAMALVAIQVGAAEQFLNALPKATGKCRLNILDALASLGDASATTALTAALDDSDREVRLAAGAGLAKIGSADSVDQLLKAADVDPGWERIRATQHCLVLAENLTKAGKTKPARKIYAHLKETRSDPSEGYIRRLAMVALQTE